MVANLHFVKQLGCESKQALEARRPARLRRADARSLGAQEKALGGHDQPGIDEYYDLARRNGALGGKLIGAGGGGFLMFYTEDKTRLRRALREAGLREVRMRFDFGGTRSWRSPDAMLAGRDPRGRSGHAAAAAHRKNPQSAGGHQRRAFPRAPVAAPARERIDRVVLCMASSAT